MMLGDNRYQPVKAVVAEERVERNQATSRKSRLQDSTLCRGRVEDKESLEDSFHELDAIARGVEAWFEEATGYSRRVAETTADIARALGLPENEVERWVASRLDHGTRKVRTLKSLLERLLASR